MLPARSTRCPFCQAPQPATVEGATSICAHCGQSYVASGAWCPRCGTANPTEAETCRACGEPLTTVGRVFQRHRDARRPPEFLEYARRQAPHIRRSEAESARRRTEDFNAQEARRQESIRAQHRKQAEWERKLVTIGLASLGGVALLVALLLLFQRLFA
jgi:zinc-ribbon domain